MYQLKGTGREKNIHLHSVSQSSWRWLGVCNPPSVGGDAEESVLGKARIPLRIGLGLFQAHFLCVSARRSVWACSLGKCACVEWSGTSAGSLQKGHRLQTRPPLGGGRALTITLHADLEHKKHFQSLSFGLFGCLFVWGASSEILTAASLSFLLCEREVMLRAAQESCWA